MSSLIDRKLADLTKACEGKIDYKGQQLAEQLTQRILWTTGLVSFLAGFVLQSLRVTVVVFGIGLLACCLTVIPAHPMYNRHPVNWLASLDDYGQPVQATRGIESKKDK